MSNLADRVWYAIHSLPRDKNGKAPSFSWLERQGNLANGSMSKIVRGTQSEVRQRTLDALAQVLGVDQLWLDRGAGSAPPLTGELPPRPGSASTRPWKPTEATQTTLELNDPYPSRAPVIAALKAQGGEDAVVSAMLAERDKDGDPGEKYWWERIEHYRKHVSQYILSASRAPASEALDHVPGTQPPPEE